MPSRSATPLLFGGVMRGDTLLADCDPWDVRPRTPGVKGVAARMPCAAPRRRNHARRRIACMTASIFWSSMRPIGRSSALPSTPRNDDGRSNEITAPAGPPAS